MGNSSDSEFKLRKNTMNNEYEMNDYASDLLQRDFYTKELNKVISDWDVRYVQLLITKLQQVIDLSSREILSEEEFHDLEHAIIYSRNNLNNDGSIKCYDRVLEQVQDVLNEMHSDEEEEAA